MSVSAVHTSAVHETSLLDLCIDGVHLRSAAHSASYVIVLPHLIACVLPDTEGIHLFPCTFTCVYWLDISTVCMYVYVYSPNLHTEMNLRESHTFMPTLVPSLCLSTPVVEAVPRRGEGADLQACQEGA